MSDLVAKHETSLVLPHSGELLDLEDPYACARALDEISDFESKLREITGLLKKVVVAEAERQGTKTLELPDGRKAVVSGGVGYEYDGAALDAGLRAAGMPEDRLAEIVERPFKVRANEAKRAAGANAIYREIVEDCRREFVKPQSVSIGRA